MTPVQSTPAALPAAARLGLISSLVFAVSACGGGGGDAGNPAPLPPPPPSASAEGVYGGTSTGGPNPAFRLLILETGQYWSLYGSEVAGGLAVAGLLQGNGTSNNGSFTSSNALDFGLPTPVAGTVSANYNPVAGTVGGTVTSAGGVVSFNGGPTPGSTYNYMTAAQLSSVTGEWSVRGLSGESIALTIATNGSFTAASALGCNFTGSVAPRASGKNVFDVAFNFGPAPCILANQPASGIALAYPLDANRTQLIVAGTNAARTFGTAAFGTRTPPAAAVCTVATPNPAPAANAPQVTLTFSNGAGVSGDLVLTLDRTRAPATVDNFLAYVAAGFYTGTVIHRHSAGFVLQGGGYSGPVTAAGAIPPLKPTAAPIVLEDNAGLSNQCLTVAMARTGAPNSATSQFFINLNNSTFLDRGANRGYAVFGSVTSGSPLVTAMVAAPCTVASIAVDGCLPVPNITITNAVRTR